MTHFTEPGESPALLARDFRRKLESVVAQAREIAEKAARASLQQLGVGLSQPFSFLSDPERDLQKELTHYSRRLGDKHDGSSSLPELDLLVEEVAYEHWHRMLFARFLSENNLLMYPGSPPVAITLSECQELADEYGARNGLELSARFAAQMLPQIFSCDSPLFKLQLPPEYEKRLQDLVAGLPRQLFLAADAVGWLYQFWQSKKKEEINVSAVKIAARELPAVTQLFTEQYMVSFMLDNSLGAWWANKTLSDRDLQEATSETELRRKAALPSVPLNYLRFFRRTDGSYALAGDKFAGWAQNLKDLKIIDPCCGSGHFLVASFLMLVPLRMYAEGLSAAEAVEHVLAENIHGLEIEKRCLELAAFALALAAWRYPGAGGYRKLPQLNLACCGQPPEVEKANWISLGEKHGLPDTAAGKLYDLFAGAPVLGSLIGPHLIDRQDDAHNAEPVKSTEDFCRSLTELATNKTAEATGSAKVRAGDSFHAAALLFRQYDLVLTNVPYLKRSKQNQTLKDFCKRYYDDAKEDLATVFLDRCLSLCKPGGTTCVVLPQNWLFLTSYRNYRRRLLEQYCWNFVVRMGAKAFQTQMWDFNVQLLSITRPTGAQTERAKQTISGIDISSSQTPKDKAEQLSSAPVLRIDQAGQLANTDCTIQFKETGTSVMLYEYASCHQGSGLADIARFRIFFWEIMHFSPDWVLHQSSPSGKSDYSGLKFITFWEKGQGVLVRSPQATIRGRKAWNKKGIACAWMGDLPVSLYGGWLYDNSAAVIIPQDEKHVLPVWCYCSSASFNKDVRQINQKLQVANATMVKVPFDLACWSEIARQRYPEGLPLPYSNDPTQWIFHGHPCGSVIWDKDKKRIARGPLRLDSTVLQIAVIRLAGYRWPAELDETIELDDEQRLLVQQCQALSSTIEPNSILCLPPVLGEPPAAERLYKLLAKAYGSAWNDLTLAELLKQSDHADRSLESWLQDKFFAQHCQLFQQRPFIWHIWDGLPEGFSALLNYHKLDNRLLQTLIYTYLGDWIKRQKQDISEGINGAPEKLYAAEQLEKRLLLILEGDSPCDIFVRWKTIENQPPGWNPDLNDGVRLNIRPFLSVSDIGKKGCGILREKPNIHWKNDRGRDLKSSPWFSIFGGERINDHHLSRTEKQAARSLT